MISEGNFYGLESGEIFWGNGRFFLVSNLFWGNFWGNRKRQNCVSTFIVAKPSESKRKSPEIITISSDSLGRGRRLRIRDSPKSLN